MAKLLSSPYWSAPAATTRDVGLHVRVSGSGPGTILLLHGLTASNLYFGAAFDALADVGRVVVPDLLGFGRSPRPGDADYGADTQVGALIAALDQLRVSAPLYVVAHSAGTLVALRLAALRPDWVHNVFAFGPPLYAGSDHARKRIAHMGLWARLFALDTVWARAACALMCRHRGAAARVARLMRPDLPRVVAEDAVQHSWASYSRTLRNLILSNQPPSDLERLQIPLILVAGEDDPVVDVTFLRELTARHTNIQLEIWPGGHDLPLRASERCVSAIRARIGCDAELSH